MSYRVSPHRRGHDHTHHSSRYQSQSQSTITRIRQFIKRKYGLSVLNSALLCALIFSWLWIFNATMQSTSDITLRSKPVMQLNRRPSRMKQVIEKYQHLKWIDEHKYHPNASLSNSSLYYYNKHKSTDPSFAIWSIEDIQSDAICPPSYPKEPPEFKQMKYVCSHLHWFKFGGNCDDNNCSDCIPPNSKVAGKEWMNTDTAPWIQQYESTLNERRKSLKALLNEHNLYNKNDGPIIVITINHGYAFLFYNWVCSLDYNQIQNIKNRTVVIPTHKETIPLIQKAGFEMIFFPEWLGPVMQRIDPQMPKTFALGAHRWVVSLQIAVISDLIELGFDVITQDSDIIYVQNPLHYILQPKFKHIDIQMMVDERLDKRGPANSGYYIVRSNCKTKVFMQTMIRLIGAVLAGRSDQIVWNTLINEKMFRMVHFQTFSREYFVGGNQINIKYKTKKEDLPLSTLLIHACWTTDQFDKIEKFWNVEHYYFTQEKCAHLYDYEMIPDLKDKKWHIRDKTKEQEAKLLALGLVRDTSNGIYTTPQKK